MLVKIGKLWLNPEKINGIIPPDIMASDPELVTLGAFKVYVIFIDQQLLVGEFDTHSAAMLFCEEIMLVINNQGEQSYPDN